MADAADPSISALLDEIRCLLAAPATGASAPRVTEIEDTLTAGYARALALEAERWRLERRIKETVALLREGRASAAELPALASGVSATDSALMNLRELLAPLQARARAARTAA